MIRTLALVGLLAAAGAATLWTGGRMAAAQAQTPACLAAGTWADGSGRALAAEAALAQAGQAQIVLLGEAHATPAHHRWQRDVIAALAGSGRPVVIGLEQLPRAAQPALDAYLAGGVDEATFLAQSRWAEVWGHDFAAYRPLFELARTQRLPMVALNVERAFVRSVAQQGFAAVAQGAPIGAPASPPAAYLQRLEAAFAAHGGQAASPGFARFVEAQSVWDRAMAEGLARALAARPGAIVVGVMGLGHVEHGHGVEHQLAALGVRGVFSAIPVATAPPCLVEPGMADALFGAD